MVRINFAENEITVKIVYYGPGLSGKTTNLQSLHASVSELALTELFSVKTKEDRTLFFDLMPIDFTLNKRVVKFKVYTVPGQVQYNSTRKIVLEGVDAIVFVADSRISMQKKNIESLENLKLNLIKNKVDIEAIPLVFQYNKRDLNDILDIDSMNSKLNENKYDYFSAVAIENRGVLETFEKIVRLTIKNTFPKYKITKHNWEIELILDQIEKKLKPLYFSRTNSINQENTTGLVFDNININGEISDSLLESAIKATDETALLYGEIKQLKNELEKRNLQLNSLLKENKFIRQFMESIFSQSGVPISVFNLNLKIINWNREMIEFIGISSKASKNMFLYEVLSVNSVNNLKKLIEKLKKTGRPLKSTLEFKLKETGNILCNVVLSPLKNLEDDITLISLFIILEKEISKSKSFAFDVNGKNILIASNSIIIQNILKKELSSAKFMEAIEKIELIRVLNVENFDYIFYDFNFPGLTGEKIYDWISFEKPQLLNSIIFLVSPDFLEKEMNFINSMGLNYIVKPISSKKIHKAFNQIFLEF